VENKDVVLLLSTISTKLGVTIEQLWDVLLKQATIAPIINTIMGLTIIIAAILFARLVSRKTSSGEWEEEGALLAWTAAMFLGAVALFFGLYLLENSINALANPEFWAIERLAKMLTIK